MKRLIQMNDGDMVATALEDIVAAEEAGIYNVENQLLYSIRAIENIPFGNKIALTDVNDGDLVIKYGAVIGQCTHSFKQGMLVHVHNVKSLTVDIPPAFKKEIMRQMHIAVEADKQ